MDDDRRSKARKDLVRLLAGLLVDDALKDREVLDAETCATLLKCSVGQVEELARAGDLPGVKIGRGWSFVRADLLAYLDERGRREAEERRAARVSRTTRKAEPPLPQKKSIAQPERPGDRFR